MKFARGDVRAWRCGQARFRVYSAGKERSNPAMARSLRIEYPGALYHVMSRGNGRQRVFLADGDYQRLVDGLESAVRKFAWQVLTFVPTICCFQRGKGRWGAVIRPRPTSTRVEAGLQDPPVNPLGSAAHGWLLRSALFVDCIRSLMRDPQDADEVPAAKQLGALELSSILATVHGS